MSMKKISAIFKKQLKDTLKNKEVLIQFVMFPAIAVIMQNAINIPNMPVNYFVILFATMFIGMAPLTSMAAIISEEKEKNSLKILMMSNVNAGEYLIGVGTYVFLICMLGSIVFAVAGEFKGIEVFYFLLIMGIGILISMMIGAAIGTWSRNQMSATSITVPVMMIFAFLPMLSMFNDKISLVSKFTYSQQINNLMSSITDFSLSFETAGVISLNFAIVIFLFVYAYKKCGLT